MDKRRDAWTSTLERISLYEREHQKCNTFTQTRSETRDYTR